MDFPPALQLILDVLWYIVPFVIVAGILFAPKFKGWFSKAAFKLSKRLLNKKTYRLIRNVTLPTGDGGTAQIDHIIVSPYGVFVVDTRDMKGEIYGSAEQPDWLQRTGRYVNRFENPLLQNRRHVKTLQGLLGLSEGQVHSLVVFLGEGRFRSEMPGNVVRGWGYLGVVRAHTHEVLSSEQVREVVGSGRLKGALGAQIDRVTNVRGIV
ncbi:nuclease-related domain-containing protein [Marinobacter fonticola]|uniref:nuclease-related domain-containing protein n=1 Tax=Marinobacter fonticola TaxID=2603215 RepID=UPI0011E71CC7|nr:nuclease-related domain-containing protein [Marinobacter fonticola]